MTPIYFYIPEKFSFKLPDNIDEYWHWQTNSTNLSPYWGRYHWVLQTYLYLKNHGLRCSLVHTLQDIGIIITHRDCLDYDFKPSRYQFIVILQVDRTTPHPYGNYHVLHNPVQKLKWGLSYKYIPSWPQVSLISRNQERENRFERIGYFGYPHNLVEDLKSEEFYKYISTMGLKLDIPSPNNWNDFNAIDVIIAIRNFGTSNAHLNKPALKLYNAWAAGVPAILGYESAYRHQGESGKDYLEAVSISDVKNSLFKLKSDVTFRTQIVNNGMMKYQQKYKPEITITKWEEFLFKNVFPAYNLWSSSRLNRNIFLLAGRARESLLWRLSE